MYGDGEKVLQIVLISGDRDESGYKMSIKEMPWVAVPFQGEKGGLEEKIPCTGYPTLGLINGVTGEVLDDDCFQEVSLDYIK